ncbi:Hypothetical protein SCF082_LOCUS32141 [Durusdinium trenchii]|uniref:Uncharacterized protein n=1 Tax=Durusdinium trenchii TaxID=1381693 RepID=A0ABP0NC09_9DINO
MVRLGSKHAADPAKFSARLNEETAAVTNAVSSGLSTVTQTLSEKLLDVSSSVAAMFHKEKEDPTAAGSETPVAEVLSQDRKAKVTKAKPEKPEDPGLRWRSKKAAEAPSASPSGSQASQQGSEGSRSSMSSPPLNTWPKSSSVAGKDRVEVGERVFKEEKASSRKVSSQEIMGGDFSLKPPTKQKKRMNMTLVKGPREASSSGGLEHTILKDLGPKGMEAFTQALKEGKQRPGCVKLCFVGHARAGKTSTLKALADKPFDTQQRSTHGVETFVLSNELLQISKPESVAAGSTATPWGVLEGSSVRELLSKGVAKRLAQQLKDQSQKEARQETPETRQSSISRSSSRQFKEESGSHFSDFSEMQEIIKMPMDLVAKAMNQTGPEDPEQVVLQTWDFAGQEMYYSMAHVFITAPGIYVLVVDLSQWLEAVTKPASVYSCGLPVELSEPRLAQTKRMPCKQLLQQIALQKRNGELKFIPWKQILSVVQCDRSRQSCSRSKEKSLLGLLADVTGHVDALEADVSSSPFAVQKVLSLRSVAWALLDWCHLSSGKMLVNKFMLLYHRVGLADVGMRPPNLAEAEFADAELCRQLQDLMSKGNDLDRAIYEAVVVRDSLRLWLQPRLKAPAEKGRRPSPYGAETTKGKCTMRDECMFKHHCDHCGSAEHGRHACEKLLQLAKED